MGNKLRGFLYGMFFVFLSLGIPTANSLADEVVLANGDKLTGAIIKVEAGKLTLKTEYAGAIEILIDKVRKIATDNPAEVHLRGGEVLKGKITTPEEGKLAVEPSPERTASTVEMNNVAAILSPIGAGWCLKLENILEYDNGPPRDVSKTDLTWILGLQYSF